MFGRSLRKAMGALNKKKLHYRTEIKAVYNASCFAQAFISDVVKPFAKFQRFNHIVYNVPGRRFVRNRLSPRSHLVFSIFASPFSGRENSFQHGFFVFVISCRTTLLNVDNIRISFNRTTPYPTNI